MNRRNWWDLRAEANAGDQGGGGGGPQTVEPAAAREFLTSWAPNADLVKTLPDNDVMAWHGNVTKNLTAAQQKALEGYDWRAPILAAKPDAKATLERMPSPVALYETYDGLRTKLSKGEMRMVTEFPKTGTDQEKATWREQNGIPPDGKYEVKLPQGLEIREQDQPLLEGFTKYAHENNIPASEVNKTAAWFFGQRAEREQQLAERAKQEELDTASQLGQEWGPEYKPIQNKIAGVLDATLPSDDPETRAEIQKAIARNPTFARMMAKIALEMNPSGTMVPGGPGAQEGTIVDELKKIDAMMKTDRGAYNKDEKTQARYRELLGAFQKVTGKEWGQAA